MPTGLDTGWPETADALVERQRQLAAATPPPWSPPDRPLRVAGCWVCFPRGYAGPGCVGDPAWSAAVVMGASAPLDRHVEHGCARAPYQPGLLALRVGPLLERAVRGLEVVPDVLLVDGTSRDHPRRAGLALHLGAALGIATVGVTHRPLLATGSWPADARGATSALRLGDEVVGCWLRTRQGTRPLVVHPGWRIDLQAAANVVSGCAVRRTPEPLRQARRHARTARAASLE